MALVNCHECNARISDQAWSCPRCGYRMYEKETRQIEVFERGPRVFDEELIRLLDDGWKVMKKRYKDEGYDGDNYGIGTTYYTLTKYIKK